MINLYTGTPGAGKSLHVSQIVYSRLRYSKKDVMANFDINLDVVSKSLFKKNIRIGNFTYVDNKYLSVEYLLSYAKKNHILGKENQTLLIIDECQVFFNPREFGKKDRLGWINFFSQHRKLGYEVILITQMDRLLDRQIRGLVEYEIKHRKVNNFKIGKLLPFPTFCAITYWYNVRERLNSEFFIFKKKFNDLYDSYKMFEDLGKKDK